MPIYVNKKNDKFFVNVKNINGTNNYATNNIEDVFHPTSLSNVYILNDGTNAALTLTTTFLTNVFTQWFLPLWEIDSPTRATFTDIALFNNRKIFRKIRPPIFKFLKWQVSTDNGVNFTDLNTGVDLYDLNTWSLKLNNLTVDDNNKVFRCIAGMQEYTLLSKHAKIIVQNWPDINTAGVSISSHPADTLANNGAAEFSVTASAPPEVSISYQWQVSVNNGFSFSDIVGETSSTLSLSNLTRADHNKIYRVKIYRPDGPTLNLPETYSAVFSKQAKLLTLIEMNITSQPQNTTANPDNTAQFNVVVSPASSIGSVSPSYQWQVSRDNGLTYTDLTGQTNSILNLSGLLINDHLSLYRVRISTSCCGTENFIIYSDPATLYTVSSTILFQTQPVSISTINSQGKFSAQVKTLCPDSCGPILYQWAYVTGTDQNPIYTIIDGQTLNYLVVNAITDNGKKFALIASQPQTNSIIISNTVTLTNANSKPTDIFLSKASIKQGNVIGDVIGTLSTQDINTDGSYTYSLLDEFPDKNSFTIDNTTSTLKANAVFNYATKSSYIIGIRSTDQGGLYVDKIFYIYIRTNVNISLANTLSTLSEKFNTSSPVKIADIRITDPFNNGGYLSEENLPLLGPSPLSLSSSNNNDHNFFQINGLNLELKAGTVLNYSTKQTFNITVHLNPEMSDSSSVPFTLNISNVNEGPTNLFLFPTSILEGNQINDTVGAFITIDPDINENFTYELVQTGNSADYADNGFFNILSGTNILRVSNVLTWTPNKTLYKITVKTTDSGGANFTKPLQILLLKRPTPPPPPPQPPKPPDSVSGDPHYYLRAFSGQRLRAIIDDNIGGDAAIAIYVRIDNEEWKAVAVNTPGIVCALDHIDYYYRNNGSTWTHLNPTQINGSWTLADSAAQIEFNKNGCFYFTGSSRGYATFYWNDPYELVKRDNIIVGGFLYWLQKAIEMSNSTIDGGRYFNGEKLVFNSYWPSLKDAGIWNPTIGIDGITEVVSRFGLNRKDFLQSSGDSNLFKTTETFNIFSSKVN